MQVIKVKASCVYCRNKSIIRKGYYYTKSKPRKHKRYYCIICKKGLNFRRRNMVKTWDTKICRVVINLINKKTYDNSKFDNRKIPFYSSRGIVRCIYKKYKIKIGKTTVHRLIREMRIQSDRINFESKIIQLNGNFGQLELQPDDEILNKKILNQAGLYNNNIF